MSNLMLSPTIDELDQMLTDKFNDATDTPEIPKWLNNTKILTTNPIKYLCCKPGENVNIPIIPLAREFYAAYRNKDTQKYDRLTNEIRTTVLTKYFELDRIDHQYREKDINYINDYSVGELVWSAINGFIFGFFNCDEINLLLETYIRLTPKYWEYYISKMTDIYPSTLIAYFMPDESKWDKVSDTTLHVTCKYMEKYDALYAKLEEESIQITDDDMAVFDVTPKDELVVTPNPEIVAATTTMENIEQSTTPVAKEESSSIPEIVASTTTMENIEQSTTPIAKEELSSTPEPVQTHPTATTPVNLSTQPTQKSSFNQPLVNIVPTDNTPFITFDNCINNDDIVEVKFDLLMPTA